MHATTEVLDVENLFNLDVEIIDDVGDSVGGVPMACATDDGCSPTCASACTSGDPS